MPSELVKLNFENHVLFCKFVIHENEYIMNSIMSDIAFIQAYNSLPIYLRQEVSDFLQFVIQKYSLNTPQILFEKSKTRQFGGLIGKIKTYHDFDEPLDDCNKYR